MNDREAENIYDDWFGLPHMDLLFHDPAQTHWSVMAKENLSAHIFPLESGWGAQVIKDFQQEQWFPIPEGMAPSPDQALHYAVAAWCKKKMEEET